MAVSFPRLMAAGLVSSLALVACSGATRAPTRAGVEPGAGDRAILTPAAQARADSGRPPYTAADVRFMSGMVPHHAQALLMAGWAPTHGASPAVRILSERMVVGQRDEIAFMQRWLRERREPVPDADASHYMMPGMDHPRLMPGMLTAEQLTQLERARGPEFDRLFLTFMIQHHEGAIIMVEQLFSAHGAAQDHDVFRFASDLNADQTTEMDRMRTMLAALPSGGRSP
ncbi:MAG: DUF305 domain-containing protein [Gemmatimonadota bacterium]|nr:DUF305 domain-containing protein [Gemmatimonadota bacterium]